VPVPINKAINAKREAASRRQEETQPTAVLALLVRAQPLPVRAARATGIRGLREKHRDGGSASSVSPKLLHQLWWDPCCRLPPPKTRPEKRWLGWEDQQRFPAAGAGGSGAAARAPRASLHASCFVSLELLENQKKKGARDDVSAAEPTSNALSLAAVRTWGRGQAQRWMQNDFKCGSKLDPNLIPRSGGVSSPTPHSAPPAAKPHAAGDGRTGVAFAKKLRVPPAPSLRQQTKPGRAAGDPAAAQASGDAAGSGGTGHPPPRLHPLLPVGVRLVFAFASPNPTSRWRRRET